MLLPKPFQEKIECLPLVWTQIFFIYIFFCEDYPKREVYNFNALHSWRLTYHITILLESPNEGDSLQLLLVNFMFLLNTSIRASGSEKKRSDIKI